MAMTAKSGFSWWLRDDEKGAKVDSEKCQQHVIFLRAPRGFGGKTQPKFQIASQLSLSTLLTPLTALILTRVVRRSTIEGTAQQDGA